LYISARPCFAANVYDESHLWTKCRDVSEVLFWRGREIHPPELRGSTVRGEWFWNDALVGHEHFEGEVATFLGKVVDYFPKGLIADRRGQGVSGMNGGEDKKGRSETREQQTHRSPFNSCPESAAHYSKRSGKMVTLTNFASEIRQGHNFP
jgi:hypothetical protein